MNRQRRTAVDGAKYTALLDEERELYVDGKRASDFYRENPGEYSEIDNRIELVKDIFEEGIGNEIQTADGTPYEVYWDSYMGHDIRIERRIEL